MDDRLTLLVLRHALTEDARPGARDTDRRLTSRGEAQARAVGDHLRVAGVVVDAVLCSSAVRARRTLDLLGLPAERPSADQVEVSDRFYSGGTDTLLEAIRMLPKAARTALLVGHAPGAPGVVYELADRRTSSATALASIAGRFPPAAMARLEADGPWQELAAARLADVRIP